MALLQYFTGPGTDVTAPREHRDRARTDVLRIRRLRRMLAARLDREGVRRVVCWGTGAMGRDVGLALGRRVLFFVDNDAAMHGRRCCGRPVRPPDALRSRAFNGRLLLIASIHDEAIVRQMAEQGLAGTALRVRPLHDAAGLPWVSRVTKRLVAASRWVAPFVGRLQTAMTSHRPKRGPGDANAGAVAASTAANGVAGGVRLAVVRERDDASVDLTGHVDDDRSALLGALCELRSEVPRLVSARVPADRGRDRQWWEDLFFDAGFRKHPRAATTEPDVVQAAPTLEFEAVPDSASRLHPMSAVRAERDLHMDMLREAGRRSWAHLARYALARETTRPGMVVLDVACGLGYGSAILADATEVARVIGVDGSAFAIAYATANFASTRGALTFHEGDATRLDFVEDASVDLAVSFETMEHLVNPLAFLRELQRVLKPGGRLVVSVPNRWIDDACRNPVPWHLHVYDFEQLHDQLSRHFEVERVYRQNAGGGWKRPQPDRLGPLPDDAPTDEDQRDAEWWVVVATRPRVRTRAARARRPAAAGRRTRSKKA